MVTASEFINFFIKTGFPVKEIKLKNGTIRYTCHIGEYKFQYETEYSKKYSSTGYYQADYHDAYWEGIIGKGNEFRSLVVKDKEKDSKVGISLASHFLISSLIKVELPWSGTGIVISFDEITTDAIVSFNSLFQEAKKEVIIKKTNEYFPVMLETVKLAREENRTIKFCEDYCVHMDIFMDLMEDVAGIRTWTEENRK